MIWFYRVLAILFLSVGGLFVCYISSASGPPALYVNGVRTIGGDFSWNTPRGTRVTEPIDLTRIAYGEENTITASMGDAIKLRNKLPWLGARQQVQITLYEVGTRNCYASWPLASRPAISKGYADPGSYCMDIYVVYRSLFVSGSAHYGAVLNVEE